MKKFFQKCSNFGKAVRLISTIFLFFSLFFVSLHNEARGFENSVTFDQVVHLHEVKKFLPLRPKIFSFPAQNVDIPFNPRDFQGNTLIIPQIQLKALIHEGENEKTLHEGVWHRPKTGTPDQGGNMVLAAFRTGSAYVPTFKDLNQLHVGSKIEVFWQKQKFVYEVLHAKTVPATAVEIEDDTAESILTLFTSTADAQNRYVVVARLITNNHPKRGRARLLKNEQPVKPLKQAAPLVAIDNMLIIEKIGVHALIHEGEGEKTLYKGIWHRPKTSSPDKGGNTVLAAHRVMYTSGPNTFFHMDKLKEEDDITVLWNNKKYTYRVFHIEVVPPTAVEIEDNTKEPILTLFTCTPLYTSEKRLVVKAKLVGVI